MQAFRSINRAGNLTQFTAALQSFDVGSQNFTYADKEGNIAYFAAGEMPLREDLENGAPVGLPPFLIRDGQGGNEWLPAQGNDPNRALPFAILPFSEMPQLDQSAARVHRQCQQRSHRQQPRQQRAQRAASRWRHSLYRFGLQLRPGHPRRTHRAAVDIVPGERPEARGPGPAAHPVGCRDGRCQLLRSLHRAGTRQCTTARRAWRADELRQGSAHRAGSGSHGGVGRQHAHRYRRGLRRQRSERQAARSRTSWRSPTASRPPSTRSGAIRS